MKEIKYEKVNVYRPISASTLLNIDLPQTFAERQHKKIAGWLFFAMQISFDLSPLGTFSIIHWIRISDFGLLDPDDDPDLTKI